MKTSAFILGARGSVPVSSQEYLRHGGDTLCVFLRLANQLIVLDAGTGLLKLTPLLNDNENDISVLLSHAHMDHLLGIPMFPALFDQTKSFHFYAKERNGLTVQELLGTLMSPPLWPFRPENTSATLSFHSVSDSFDLGRVHVETMEGIHPGGVTLFRLTGDGKSIVYITDCVLTEEFFPKAVSFAKDCDLLFCDGQYSEEEWATRRYFGHSSWIAAARLGAACNARQMRIIHHNPFRTDADLDAVAETLKTIYPGCTFARAGEEISL